MDTANLMGLLASTLMQNPAGLTPRDAVPFGIAAGVGMFLGWMIGYIRGHKAGLRERAARFRR
jgi:hypothetical protein